MENPKATELHRGREIALAPGCLKSTPTKVTVTEFSWAAAVIPRSRAAIMVKEGTRYSFN